MNQTVELLSACRRQLEMKMRGAERAVRHLADAVPRETAPVMIGEMAQRGLPRAQALQRQLRISPDGQFDDLIYTPNRDAHIGKDQVRYRGQCHEG
ncbi:hypothetical protein [Shimia sediminis]|uniref:hypothetical protein n=1 Tax=Shimia sediminis TaxID=2497945 RepID=UPI0013DEF0BB|nr:hypothetical protein [Shimia sediminis]